MRKCKKLGFLFRSNVSTHMREKEILAKRGKDRVIDSSRKKVQSIYFVSSNNKRETPSNFPTRIRTKKSQNICCVEIIFYYQTSLKRFQTGKKSDK